MKLIAESARKYGIKIIEDASHAVGGKYGNRFVGSCEFSDIAIFSFHPVKIITTAEGGAILTNSPELDHSVKRLRTHGITKNPEEFVEQADLGGWYYEMQELGFNYRLSDIHAALGVSQMKKLSGIIEKRKLIAEYYNEQFKELPVKTPKVQDGCLSAFHLYIVQFDLENEVPP